MNHVHMVCQGFRANGVMADITDDQRISFIDIKERSIAGRLVRQAGWRTDVVRTRFYGRARHKEKSYRPNDLRPEKYPWEIVSLASA